MSPSYHVDEHADDEFDDAVHHQFYRDQCCTDYPHCSLTHFGDKVRDAGIEAGILPESGDIPEG